MAGLLIMLGLVGRADRWPPPENPPRQGEALDAAALRRGAVGHSAGALARLIREPENTWSNLAFILGGAWLLTQASRRRARGVGVALIATGVGSFLYHASASRTLRHLDVGAMYWLFIGTAAFAIASIRPRLARWLEAPGTGFAAAAAVAAGLVTAGRNLRLAGVKPLALTTLTALTAAVLAAALGLTALRRRTVRARLGAGGALALFALAVICQVGDRPGGWLVNPEGVIQAHALWHVLSAAALVLAVRTLDTGDDGGDHFTPARQRAVADI